MEKKVELLRQGGQKHWVGDGFPVQTMFTYADLPEKMSPFLLMDYAGPEEFTPSAHRRGVGEHPHRGFETVTIVYAGEVDHRDSNGGGGSIRAGDVQWMTAASGVVHEEFHSRNFSQKGGLFELIQLWVNLPAKYKMSRPRYQGIRSEQIPTVTLDSNAGILRVIAGVFDGFTGPAETFTPINLWDLCLNAGSKTEYKVRAGDTTAIFVLSGEVELSSGEKVSSSGLVILGRQGECFKLHAHADSKVLIMNGAVIDEPVVGRGPFVMNTLEEIQQAYADYKAGRMGTLKGG